MDVNNQLLEAGLRRVVQCKRGTERDAFGGPLRETWLDTDWDSIKTAQLHQPKYIYRNAIIAYSDEPFEESETTEMTRSQATNTGIPVNEVSRFQTAESYEDCGCGLGRGCRFSNATSHS